MEDISQILKEAKPLYFKRKKIKKITQSCLLGIVPVILCTFLILPLSITNQDSQVSYYSSTSSTSVIEQMGLPTDDYGLLKVD